MSFAVWIIERSHLLPAASSLAKDAAPLDRKAHKRTTIIAILFHIEERDCCSGLTNK
jgi:hypothetical protein